MTVNAGGCKGALARPIRSMGPESATSRARLHSVGRTGARETCLRSRARKLGAEGVLASRSTIIGNSQSGGGHSSPPYRDESVQLGVGERLIDDMDGDQFPMTEYLH